MLLSSTASVDPDACRESLLLPRSVIWGPTVTAAPSPLPLMTAGLIGYGLPLRHWKWNWSEMTAPLDYLRCSFLKVPYGNCHRRGCLRGALHILFHQPCLLLWMRCNVVAKCISTSLSPMVAVISPPGQISLVMGIELTPSLAFVLADWWCVIY